MAFFSARRPTKCLTLQPIETRPANEPTPPNLKSPLFRQADLRPADVSGEVPLFLRPIEAVGIPARNLKDLTQTLGFKKILWRISVIFKRLLIFKGILNFKWDLGKIGGDSEIF